MLTLSQLFKKLSKKQTSKNFFWKEKLLLWQIHSKRKMLRLLFSQKLMVFISFVQLNEILAASNLEPAALSVVTRKLEDVLDAKNGAIKDLQVITKNVS